MSVTAQGGLLTILTLYRADIGYFGLKSRQYDGGCDEPACPPMSAAGDGFLPTTFLTRLFPGSLSLGLGSGAISRFAFSLFLCGTGGCYPDLFGGLRKSNWL